MTKICFVASGPIEWGSARMRCYWPARYMEDAQVVTINEIQQAQSIPEADVYIWQKHMWPGLVAELAKQGKQNWWDVCDPMWWFSPEASRKYLEVLNGGIVASNKGLADDFTQWAGREAYVIPDRLEPEHFPLFREHRDVKPVRFIWFGVAVNRVALGAAWANLDRLHANGYEIELTIFDDRPDVPLFMSGKFPVYYTRWSLENENRILASHDIALLPPYPGAWGEVKSNNKILTANICGLPVIVGYSYDLCEKMVSNHEYRQALNTRHQGIEHGNAKDTARQWEELVANHNS